MRVFYAYYEEGLLIGFDLSMKILWLLIFFVAFIWSAMNPEDRFTWFLEVSPAIIGLGLIVYTYKTFKLTTLLYILILIHCIILMIGGHYTYAKVPFFDWLKDHYDLQRNGYDKLGHLAQGFIPAILVREILIRKKVVNILQWRGFIIVCICLAFSAFYELIEWGVALASGESAEAFLGTQGYVWDTQSDMGWALLGAVIALFTLAKLLNRQLDALGVLEN